VSSSVAEDEEVVADSRQENGPHKTVIVISSDEEEESGSEAEYNVEEADMGKGEGQFEQDGSEAEEEVEDVFEGFDVNPEDKEFFQKLLDIAPLEAVMELTGKSRRAKPRTLPDSTLPDSTVESTSKASWIPPQSLLNVAPDEQKSKRVKIFAERHLFREQEEWTQDDLLEYKDDVYEFAKAAGVSDFHAQLEVGKAIGAWKRGREPRVLLARYFDAEEIAREAREKRKAEKKARRKLNRMEKLSSRNSSAVPELKMPSSQIHLKQSNPQTPQPLHYLKQAAAAFALKKPSGNDLSLSTADEKSVGLALKTKRLKMGEKKLRKKAKLGPKKSEYFSKPDSKASPVSTDTQDELAPSLKPENFEFPKVQRDKQEEGRYLKKAKSQLGKPAQKVLRTSPDPIQQIAQEARKAINKAPLLANEATMEKDGGTVVTTPAEPEPVEKKKTARSHERKRKRQRKRNKNRLPEDDSGQKEVSGRMMGEERTSDLPPKKRSHGEFQKINIEMNLLHHNLNSGDGTGQPAKRERGDRGRGRKRKNKNEDLEVSVAREPKISAIPASTNLLESIETNLVPSKKKRKRSKSRAGEENIEMGELAETADVDPLAEVVDTNAQKEKRLGNSKKKARNTDALDAEGRLSNQSSKVHHSQ
jgi:hypothetical protein